MARMQCLVAILFSLGGTIEASRGPRILPARHGSLATIPVRRYAQDCFQHVSRLAALQAGKQNKTSLPGAGMNPDTYTPFGKVLKDGFFQVACAKDQLFHNGDKFGDGKYSYKLGDVSGVSIVHYTQLIAKEDREEMSHEVCFSFCRTIPDMHYFGIVNGRDCYCTPYYRPIAGDSSECDAVCPGKPTEFCGGKYKSSVFEMHDCQDSMENLAGVLPKTTDAVEALSDVTARVGTLGSMMQNIGVFWQDVASHLGQPAPSDLMQTAKMFAGELVHSAEAAQNLISELDTVAFKAQGWVSGNHAPQTFEEITAVEDVTNKAEALIAKADDVTEDLQELEQLAKPKFDGDFDAGKQYYPLTYFVDKKIESLYSVCGGTNTKKPIINATRNDCSMACDADVHNCVGFSYFHLPGSPSMCFLFSGFKTVTYVVECKGSAAFLQSQRKASNGDAEVGCFGKLSEFPSSIAPQASGKCDGCLKKVQKFCKP